MRERIIKTYSDYIKESRKINEDIEDFDTELGTDPVSQETDIESNNVESDPEMEISSEFGDEVPPSELDETEPTSSEHIEGEEEEGGQYIGQRMISELADKLGAEVIDNAVVYNGKKINFFSETEMFHVDGKKFKTADEVVDHLSGESTEPIGGSSEEITNIEEPSSPISSEIEEIEPSGSEIIEEPVEELEEEPVMMEHKSYRRTRTFESFLKDK